MKKSRLIVLFFFFAAGFWSCKEEDIPGIAYTQQGFIRGTIVGIASDGTPLDEDFNYTHHLAYAQNSFSAYRIETDGSVIVNVYRKDFTTSGDATLTILLESETDTDPQIAFDLTYAGGGDELVRFTTNGINPVLLSNFTLDFTTGRLTGAFIMENPDNTSGNPAIVQGEFDVLLSKVVL